MPQPPAQSAPLCATAMTRSSVRSSVTASENALIHAHWPKALRWMLEGEPARPIGPALVHGNLRQLREDKVYLVGGTLDTPNAVAPIEHISGPGSGTPGQLAASLRGLGATCREGHALGRSVRLQHEAALVELARGH